LQVAAIFFGEACAALAILAEVSGLRFQKTEHFAYGDGLKLIIYHHIWRNNHPRIRLYVVLNALNLRTSSNSLAL
jgi:hypothetical protein